MKKENSFHSFEIEFADAAKCLAHPATNYNPTCQT
jgi:hypothetical protein